MDKAFYSAIISFGMEVFGNPSQLIGYLMDVVPGLKKEINIFSNVFKKEYVIYIKEAFCQGELSEEMAIYKLRYILIEDEGLAEKWADMICESLLGAIRYIKGMKIPNDVAEVTDVDFSNISMKRKYYKKQYKCNICGWVLDSEIMEDVNCQRCGSERWIEYFGVVQFKEI